MIEEFFKRITAEASSRELGFLTVLLGLGYIIGSLIAGASWLPGGLTLIGAAGWDLAFTAIIYGAVRMLWTASEARREASLELAKDQILRKNLGTSVERTLDELASDAAAYKSRSQKSATSTFDFDFQSLSSRGVRAQEKARPDQLLEKIRDDLLSSYDFFLAGQLEADQLEAAREKAVSDHLKVRSGFGLPATPRLRELEGRLEGSPAEPQAVRLDEHF